MSKIKPSNTCERLNEILHSRGLKQVDILNLTKDLCNNYDVKFNKSDISQYISGKTEPNQDKLFILSKALDVEITWLMGYDTPMTKDQNSINNKCYTVGEQIKKRRLELGYSVEDVAEMLGKNRATIYRYENNEIENLPANILEPLAKVLQTTPTHLMGWEDNHTFNTTTPIEKESELVHLAKKCDLELTKEQKRNIIRYINFIFDEEKE